MNLKRVERTGRASVVLRPGGPLRNKRTYDVGLVSHHHLLPRFG